MAEWQSTNTKSADEYSVMQSMDDRMTSREGTRDTSFAFLGRDYDHAKYDVVGINGTNARSSAEFIVQSTKKVMDQIEGIKMNDALLNGAIKGQEVQTALTNYLDKVKAYCSAVVSDINAFADKLYEVSRVWEESQRSYASGTIDESANSSFSGSTTEAYRTKEAGGAGFASVN